MTRHRTHRNRRHRGGGLNGNPPSAWGWGLGTVGDGWTQFMNSLTLQPGQNLAAASSNAIVPIGDPNAQTQQGNINPNLSGGRRRGSRRRSRYSRRGRGKRGGDLSGVLATAAVPGALLLMNQSMRRRRRSGHRRR